MRKWSACAPCGTGAYAPFIANTGSGYLVLAEWLGDPDGIIIALEPTGGYERAVWQALNDTGFGQ